MSLVSSNPQPQWAVLRDDGDTVYDNEAEARKTLDFLVTAQDGYSGWKLYVVREIVGADRDAWYGRTPQAPSAERSDEDLTAAVSAVLQRDFRLRIGPNTRRHITDGQERIPLSLRECDDVAQAAVAAPRKVTS